ncbi:hypothetical protein [Crossiella cryophila]|uniref:Uncharacterized protein n=1 Tax=Crossiella cryophila TaxID=43355 RepID=A0A7W7CA46_9PSEU|nr:hypothetical protein [Crossiella cryophila]MBB4677207.1 hypothetical protein [Crossiella cryophila]
MRRSRLIPLVIASTTIVATGIPGAAASTHAPNRTFEQVIACEYVVRWPGTHKFATSQFDVDESIEYLRSDALVWADPRNFVNRRHPREHFTVRELAGSGGGWVMAASLAKTSAKCLPL